MPTSGSRAQAHWPGHGAGPQYESIPTGSIWPGRAHPPCSPATRCHCPPHDCHRVCAPAALRLSQVFELMNANCRRNNLKGPGPGLGADSDLRRALGCPSIGQPVAGVPVGLTWTRNQVRRRDSENAFVIHAGEARVTTCTATIWASQLLGRAYSRRAVRLQSRCPCCTGLTLAFTRF